MELRRGFYTFLLAGIAIFPYTSQPTYSYIFFVIFIFILGLILIVKKKILINQELIWAFLIFLSFFLLIVFQNAIRMDFNLINSSTDITQRFLVVTIFILTIAIFKTSNISQVLNTILLLFFIVGLVSLSNFYLTGNRIFNENTLGFFIVPYLGLKIVESKGRLPKILMYIGGLFILYLTNGRASLLAFFFTPFWLLVIRYPVLRRIFPAIYISLSIIIPFVLVEVLLQLDGPLTGRGALQEAYTLYLKKDLIYFFFGTGEVILSDEVVSGLGPHNSWLALMFTYGLLGFIVNFLFILYCIKVEKITNKEKFLLLTLYYIFTIQNFEVINIGGVSFLSLLLLLCLLLLKNTKISPLKHEVFESSG